MRLIEKIKGWFSTPKPTTRKDLEYRVLEVSEYGGTWYEPQVKLTGGWKTLQCGIYDGEYSGTIRHENTNLDFTTIRIMMALNCGFGDIRLPTGMEAYEVIENFKNELPFNGEEEVRKERVIEL